MNERPDLIKTVTLDMTELWYGVVVSHKDFVHTISMYLDLIQDCEELSLEDAKTIDEKLGGHSNFKAEKEGEDGDEESEEEEDETKLDLWVSDLDLLNTLFTMMLKTLHVLKCGLESDIKDSKYYHHERGCRAVSRLDYHVQGGSIIVGLKLDAEEQNETDEIMPIEDFCVSRRSPQAKEDLEGLGLPVENIGTFVTNRST